MRAKSLAMSLTGVASAALLTAQAPVFSPEFQVNSYTTAAQYGATAANLGPTRPASPNLRQQMAVFLVKTFDLQLYGE